MAGDDDLSRRSFLGATSAALLAAASGCSADDEPAREDGRYAPVPVEPGRAAVGVVGAPDPTDVDHAVRRAIALAGGLDAIGPGQTVFIKPNAVHGVTTGLPGIVTSHAVLAAVIRAVRSRRPAHIVVGDRSWRQSDSVSVFQLSGLEETALDAGADEVYPAPRPSEDPSAWLLVQPPEWEETWSAEGGVLVMKRIVEADHFIDLPVCKNHRWAAFSLAMKNLIGAIGDDSRDPLHFNEGDPDRLSRDIAILNGAFTPTLCILDALTAMVSGGPEGVLADRVVTNPGLLAASRDRVALDAFGAAVLRRELKSAAVPTPDPMFDILNDTPSWLLPQITHAISLGLGISGAELVELRFEGVPGAEALETLFRAT